MDSARFRQRLGNLGNAHLRLVDACALESYSDLELAGLVQTFEFTFELAWKTLKDLLEYEGYDVATPREVIRRAFEAGMIDNAELWLEALENRNRLAHTYNAAIAAEALRVIKGVYAPMLAELVSRLEGDWSDR